MFRFERPTLHAGNASTDLLSAPAAAKPRLLFFRNHGDLPPFILSQLHQHVLCLSAFFEVRVIKEKCNYKEICESFQPDLTLVEAGVYGVPPDAADKCSHPEVPKLGFLNADAYCPSRNIFLREMERWGIVTYFTMSVSMPEYLPSIADQLFLWPNFIDPTIYRDYEQSKIIPVLNIGSQAMHYPWRNRINKIIAQHYPSLVCPHFGWSDPRKATRMVYDIEYAKLINSSWIAPTCGTVAREIVRKHFEIPGANSCLVTERTDALEDAGFVDMQNCVFVTEADVIDRLDYLFSNRDLLTRISIAGRHLVHSQHTVGKRDQILQWYNLNNRRKPNQRIVQSRPFGPLVLADSNSRQRNYQNLGNSMDRAILREAYKQLWLGNYVEADRNFTSCLNYHRMPEPYLGLTLSSLRRGNSGDALRWIGELLNYGFEIDSAIGPDPVEWAYFIVSLLCSGKLAEATKCASQFPRLRHEELDRCRWVIGILNGMFELNPQAGVGRSRPSIHQLPELNLAQWVDEVCRMLKACQQSEWCDQLHAWLRNREAHTVAAMTSETPPSLRHVGSIPELVLPSIPGSLKIRIEQQIPDRIRPFLAKLRATIKGRDAFASVVRRWARESRASRALLLGASYRSACTHAFLAGIRDNPSVPSVVCWGSSPSDSKKLDKRFAHAAQIEFGSSSSSAARSEASSQRFDLVLIDRCSCEQRFVLETIAGAETVLVKEPDTNWGHTIVKSLLSNHRYVLADDITCKGKRSIVLIKAHPLSADCK